METKSNYKSVIIIGGISFLIGIVTMGVFWYLDSRKQNASHRSIIKKLTDSIEERMTAIQKSLEPKEKEE